jgi:hypothetical protein
MSTDDILKNLSLTRNIAAYHWNRDKQKQMDYNENNPGFGLEYQDGDRRYMIGQYLNSLRKNSNYALMGYTPLHADIGIGRFSAGVVGGGITGYPTGVVTPAAGLLGSYDNGNFGVNLMAVPNAKIGSTDVDGFLGLQAKYNLK